MLASNMVSDNKKKKKKSLLRQRRHAKFWKEWTFVVIFSMAFHKDSYCVSLVPPLHGKIYCMWLWTSTGWGIAVNVILSNSVCLHSPLEQQCNKEEVFILSFAIRIFDGLLLAWFSDWWWEYNSCNTVYSVFL